jgi:hypothetical protein
MENLRGEFESLSGKLDDFPKIIERFKGKFEDFLVDVWRI